jgi:zinc transport system substrate-binding protein
MLLSNFGLAANRLPVLVSIAPQKFFVQQIGKDLVDIQVMVQPGASPHIYEPKPQQMAGLSGTRLYFAIGVPFENVWLKKIASANPGMKIIFTDHGIEKIPMTAHHHHQHEAEDDSLKGYLHNEEGEDHDESQLPMTDDGSHGTRDPHIWLSPPLVMAQARLIRDALQENDPRHSDVYAANYSEFVAQVEELDTELRNIFAGKNKLEFIVFHPSWGYFAHAYGLSQVPIEIEGKDPKPAQLKELIEHAIEKGIKVIFVQPQFSTKSAELVAREIGGQVVFADPLAEDWLSNLRQVAGKFKAALK